MKSISALLRVHQYIKNLFVFAPLFFAAQAFEPEQFLNALMAFVAFSLCASSVYILNDVRDIEDDRLHEKKKLRPIPSGQISISKALVIAAILVVTAFAILISISIKASFALGIYVLMNLAYSFFLKHVAIIDVTIIALGFVLRLFVGALVCEIELTSWIVIMTFLLALFLALAKRRDDVIIFTQTGKKMRKVIDGYNQQFLDVSMTIMGAVVIVAYLFYTTSGSVFANGHDYLYLTSIFVVIGILRYLQITIVEENSGSPTQIVLKDLFMQLVLLGWVASFFWIIYL